MVRYIGQGDFVLERDLDPNLRKQTLAPRNSNGREREADDEGLHSASRRVVFQHGDARGLCFFFLCTSRPPYRI